MGTQVTMAQIATEAGVSIATVSKVLNGRADVSAGTRARVEGLLARYDYRPRRAASGAPPVPVVDLVFHQLGNPWAVEMMRGADTAARAAGAALTVTECGHDWRPQQAWLDSVVARRPSGVVLVFTTLDDDQRAQLRARAIPLVVVDPLHELPDEVPTVGSANWQGGRMAVKHLLGLGHRRIAVIGGPREVPTARMRVDGCLDAFRTAGVAVDEDLVRYGRYRHEDGLEIGRELLARPDRPTAVFAGSDMQALGVIRAAAELGLSIPGDLSVVGYDDIPLADWVVPRLTTVRQPLIEMAETAVRMVLDLAAGVPVRRLDLAVELVERASTAPPA